MCNTQSGVKSPAYLLERPEPVADVKGKEKEEENS